MLHVGGGAITRLDGRNRFQGLENPAVEDESAGEGLSSQANRYGQRIEFGVGEDMVVGTIAIGVGVGVSEAIDGFPDGMREKRFKNGQTRFIQMTRVPTRGFD